MLVTLTNFFLTTFFVLIVILTLELLDHLVLQKNGKVNLSKILLIVLMGIISLQGFFALWNPIWTNGDEPHYLVVTSSIIKDHDLTLNNNYDNKDYFEHHAYPEPPHALVGKDGRQKPFHGILLSFILAPGYYILSLQGARLTMFILFLVGLVFLYLIQRQLGFSKNITFFSLIIYSLQAPIFIYSSSLYPDMLLGNIVVASTYLALEGIKTRKNYLLSLSGLLMGISVFLHFKIIAYIAYAILPILFLTYKNSKFQFHIDKKLIFKNSFYILPPIFLLILASSWLSYYWFGYFRPDYMTPFLKSDVYVGYGNPISNIIANLLDYDRGIFWHGPLLVLLIPGLFVWFKKSRISFIYLFIPSFVYLLNAMLFKDWTAGWAPIGRYLMTSLPMTSIAFAYLFEEYKKSRAFYLGLIPFLLANIIFIITIFNKNYVGYPTGKYNFYYNDLLVFFKLEKVQKFINIDILNGGNSDLIKAYLVFGSLIMISYILLYRDRLKLYFVNISNKLKHHKG
jgi:hypothetical protein